jgi:anti-sigma B factor antagonist
VEDAHLGRICQMEARRQLDTTVIRLSGEFDLSCEDAFFEELGRTLDSQTSTLILDLQALQFIDSTGLRMLLSLDNLARTDGLDFTVFCRDGTVRRVLRETGLDGVLPLVDPSGFVPAADSPV